jgi:hypothetical protein
MIAETRLTMARNKFRDLCHVISVVLGVAPARCARRPADPRALISVVTLARAGQTAATLIEPVAVWVVLECRDPAPRRAACAGTGEVHVSAALEACTSPVST